MPATMLLGAIQLLCSHRQAGGGKEVCSQFVLITYLVHKLLGIATRFFVSFIKSTFLKISVLKRLFSACVQNCKSNKFVVNNHIIIIFHMEKFLWKFFFDDRNLRVVYQFSHRYFQWKLDCILSSMYILFSSPTKTFTFKQYPICS